MAAAHSFVTSQLTSERGSRFWNLGQGGPGEALTAIRLPILFLLHQPVVHQPIHVVFVETDVCFFSYSFVVFVAVLVQVGSPGVGPVLLCDEKENQHVFVSGLLLLRSLGNCLCGLSVSYRERGRQIR